VCHAQLSGNDIIFCDILCDLSEPHGARTFVQETLALQAGIICSGYRSKA
jgi:hypothetical protein